MNRGVAWIFNGLLAASSTVLLAFLVAFVIRHQWLEAMLLALMEAGAAAILLTVRWASHHSPYD